jgi:P-type Cu+ transporter
MAVAGLHDHSQVSEQEHGASSEVTVLAVSGMTCNNCARHVAEAIQEVKGVRNAFVDLDAQQATVRWESSGRNVPAVLSALDEAGYPAREVVKDATVAMKKGVSGWMLNLLLGIPVTLVLMLGEWVLRLGMVPWFQWLAFALASVVQVFAGARFYKGAFAQLKVRRSNMDTLVALGSTTAFAYSAWALLSGHGGHVYFMEASAIITLISVGHWLESRMAVKASGALRKLLDLAPAMARKVQPDGTIRDVPVSELQPAINSS